MDTQGLVGTVVLQAAPIVFGIMICVAVGFIWVAFAPGRRTVEPFTDRLDEHIDGIDLVEQEEMQRSFGARVLLPILRRLLKILGRMAPQHGMETTRQLLIRAGDPGGLTALDFYGLRLLTGLMLGGLGFWAASQRLPLLNTVSAALVAGVFGFFFPSLWLRARAAQRQREIERALPNALDMLTIGVEAGLAFESAMLRVSDHWDNALTRELRRAVLEMRVGASRDAALQRLADRADVADLRTFVIVLVQSTRLGVSIAQVLHNQSVEMRQKRLQRAEELARQAPVKLSVPLVILIFPALLVVIMGPAIPGLLEMMSTALGGGG